MPSYIIASSPQPQGGNLHCYHLPKGMLHLRLTQRIIDEETFYELGTTSHIIPDPLHRYFLKYRKRIWSNDEIDIRFNSDGFLTSISRKKSLTPAEKEDAPVVSNPIKNDPPKETQGFPAIYEATFDPFDAQQLLRINKDLRNIQEGIQLHIEVDETDPIELESMPTQTDEALYPGILCRVAVAVHIIFSYGNKETHHLLRLPHPEKNHLVEIPARIASDGHFRMDFNEWGYPVYIHFEKKSLQDKLMGYPLRLFKSIMEIPAKIFRIRIDSYTNKQTLIEGQMALAEAQHRKAMADATFAEATQMALVAQKQVDEVAQKELDGIHQQLIQVLADKKRLESISLPIGQDMDAFDLKLQVLRYSSGRTSSLGLLFDITDKRKFLAFTLEDRFREEKVKAETRIPAGTYGLQLRTEGGFHERYLKKFKSSLHKGMLHVQNVPGFEYILIHSGNDEDDTAGCLLVGNQTHANNTGRSKGKVLDSVQAYKRIYPPIADALADGKTVGIEYIDYDEMRK